MPEPKKPVYKMCEFERNGVCHALACFANRPCGARDDNGNPVYSTKPQHYNFWMGAKEVNGDA